MAWNGSGGFSRTDGTESGSEVWQDNATAGTKIRADRHDNHDQDLADGIAACLTKNNEAKPTAHFDPNAGDTYDLGDATNTWRSAYLTGDVVLKERADHQATPTAAYGQIWVKSDTPSTLYYTDDAGTDHRISPSFTQLFAIKAADESVSSSTTLQDDDDLTITIAANAVYAFEFFLIVNSASTTPDFSWQFIEPGTTTFNIFYHSQYSGATEGYGILSESNSAQTLAVTTGNTAAIRGSGSISADGTGGVFKLQWAQNVSDATAVTLEEGSWIKATALV